MLLEGAEETAGAGAAVPRSGALDDDVPPALEDPDGGPAGDEDPEEGSDVVGAEDVGSEDVGSDVVGADGCDEVGAGDAAGLLLARALVGVTAGVVVGAVVGLTRGALVGVSAAVGSGACVEGAGSALDVVPLVVPLVVPVSSGGAADELLGVALPVEVSDALAEVVAVGSSAWATSGIPSTPRAASPTAPRARALRAAEGVTGGVRGRRAWRCPVGVVVGADPHRWGAAGGRRPLMVPDASWFVKSGTVARRSRGADPGPPRLR
ncbi:hypothetical protein [Quadrisphaera sp. INWT6]|uniref:hypothetical protein n=1 Tax=Quadrisphaera sp. INWT6 TaxID=2596917 RepID=UPI001891F59A|nr:hypothetical protein [Quadrisphaera sp. INWT6]MBF5080342.1 hypothetical protein [Quadrisphaera sp. INWT6]